MSSSNHHILGRQLIEFSRVGMSQNYNGLVEGNLYTQCFGVCANMYSLSAH